MVEEKMGNEKKEQPQPEPPVGSCHFFVKRKRRYCRFTRAKDSNYCAEHATIFDADVGKKRVLCPYDGKHTCYEAKLNHHMKKCPSRPKDMPAYYSAGINSGDDAGETVPDPKATVLTVPQAELEDLIDKVNQLYKEHIVSLGEEVLTHSCMQEEIERPGYGTAAIRHRKQQASLIGHMESLGLLVDNRCFLEMGAGKGQLSHWLHGAVKERNNIGFLLIDRSHVRNKMDNLHKEEGVMERIRIDIEHLRLDKVTCLCESDRSVVAFGKHLCGPATDLALRCVTETLAQETQHGEGAPRKRLKSESRQLAGAVIALCCHHRCAWRPYVGKGFFQECGLTARDFQVIASMSSWATCAWKGWSSQRKAATEKGIGARDGGIEGNGEVGLSKEDKFNLGVDSGDNVGNVAHVDKQKDAVVEQQKKKISGTEMDNKNNVQNNKIATFPTSLKAVCGRVSEASSTEKGRASGQTETSDETEEVEEEHQNVETMDGCSINSKLTQSEREQIGRKCKRLIDHGRICYLQEHGLRSTMKIYIEEFFTPENVVLLAS
ncbi:tRNA:m(4)X modification enzyme TRM13 homolog isoform X2 [Mya arenaria]|uniref:tRNA:m(4)X modification enzyme TRM13 homolog isoform X2 n=1 Tax=Mya arenaria TaxID=6604 RepID=UPI0022E3A97E|nr:tRNA:m(4)X modification enzyme TRM13 homolog isoform X2 [Mya arenaria]